MGEVKETRMRNYEKKGGHGTRKEDTQGRKEEIKVKARKGDKDRGSTWYSR